MYVYLDVYLVHDKVLWSLKANVRIALIKYRDLDKNMPGGCTS